MKKNNKKMERTDKPRITVGLDLGDRHTYYCVLNEDGEVVEEGRMSTTEAALRISFPAAAADALAASKPVGDDRPVWERLTARVESLVTVRQGDRGVVGDPATGTIAKAKAALDAGDLDGAIAALKALNPDAMAAMAPWLNRAVALRDARSALAEMQARP